jgi:hypothetical protein
MTITNPLPAAHRNHAHGRTISRVLRSTGVAAAPRKRIEWGDLAKTSTRLGMTQ